MANPTELFDQAVACHQRGDLAQAENLYRQIIAADTDVTLPKHAPAHNNLGIVLALQGRPTEACTQFRAALRIDPNHTGALNNLGNTLQNLGQFAPAAECFRHALRLNPNQPNAHNNLGNALVALGEHEEGIACFSQALRLDPKHSDARNNLGLAFVVQNKLPEAIACFREVTVLDPNYANAWINLGNALALQNQHAQAADCFRRAISLQPNYANLHDRLGQALEKTDQVPAALQSYRRALELDPNNASAYNNLGNALVAQGNLTQATECYRQALSIRPDNTPARDNLANAFTNLGNALKDQGQLDQAEENYRQALALDAGHKMARWNRSLLRLLRGNFAEGWRDYELRWELPEKVKRSFTERRWDGAPLNGQTILVYAEQALGDTIQLVRYLPLVQQRGGRMLFECQRKLVNLMQGVAGADGVFAAGETLPAFDCQVPLVSLPGILGTTLETIPSNIPYLRRAARRKPAGTSTHLQVGLAWQGSMNQRADRRSVSLARFAPLGQVPNVNWFSLQVGPGAAQLATPPFPIADLGKGFNPNSLSDLAASLANFDLVITVDTSVAHLAGALGMPVWTLLPYIPDWRWLLERTDSPWYPTMRLFRQKKFDDWSGVFEDVAAALIVFKSPFGQL